jgi:hypothetical protein
MCLYRRRVGWRGIYIHVIEGDKDPRGKLFSVYIEEGCEE